EVARLMVDAGIVVMTAFISPFRRDRALVREMIAPGEFIEIYCNASLETCEHRDVKGLYRKARAGQIPEFTGISSPYEAPGQPDLTLPRGPTTGEQCVQDVVDYLAARQIIPAG